MTTRMENLLKGALLGAAIAATGCYWLASRWEPHYPTPAATNVYPPVYLGSPEKPGDGVPDDEPVLRRETWCPTPEMREAWQYDTMGRR